MQKSYQANAPRHDQMNGQTIYEQEGRTANIFYDKKQAKIEKITPQICAD